MKSLSRLLMLLLLTGTATPVQAQSFIEGFGEQLEAIVQSYDRSDCTIGVKVGELAGYGPLCFNNQGTDSLEDDVVTTSVYSGGRVIGFLSAHPYLGGIVYAATEMSTETSPARTGGVIVQNGEIAGLFGDEAIAIRRIQAIGLFKESLDNVFATTP